MNDYVLHIKPAGAEHFLNEFEQCETQDYTIRVAELPAGWDTTIGIAGFFPEMTLKDDEYFLLCDNRTSSSDSRIWGVVNGSQVIGRVLLRYFPFDTFSRL
jgi:signal peptidase I